MKSSNLSNFPELYQRSGSPRLLCSHIKLYYSISSVMLASGGYLKLCIVFSEIFNI